MLKKRFSTTLLALVVAAVIPGSVFAADVASESTGEVSAPASVAAPADSTNEADNSGGVDATSASTGSVGEAQNPSEAPTIEATQQEGDSDQDADVVLPKEDAEGEQAPDVIEPDPEDDRDEITAPTPEATTPEVETESTAPVTEPEIEDGTGVVDGEQIVETEVPVVEEQLAEEVVEPEIPVVEPEVIAEEELLPLEEVVVTEAAIIIEEPVAATLTITHRLIVGDKHSDETQTIEGLEVGQAIDLTQYLETKDWSECISQIINITLEGTENTIILEYGVKADSGVIVVIEDSEESADGEIR